MSFLRSTIDGAADALRSGGLRTGAAVLLVAVAATACRDPLNVPDPNSIQASDLDSPAAVPSLVNGSLKNMNEMVGGVAAIYGAASDEVRWIGSRDAWGSLSRGQLDDPANEFSDATFPEVTEARFMADRAISKAEEFKDEIADQTQLVHAYLQGAVVYATIADAYDDFVIPDEPGAAAPPIGPSNMVQLYDQAIQWLNSAESLAKQLGDTELANRALAYRARVRHAKAVWGKLNPPGSVPSEPLVANEQMAQDARAFLQRVGTTADWRWQAQFSNNTTGGNNVAFQINERGELQFGPSFVEVVEGDEVKIKEIVIDDPVTGETSPVFKRKLAAFRAAGQFAPLNIVTAREIHLLLAEHNLAQGNTQGFRTHINHVRRIAGQAEYTGQVPAMQMLEHTRKVHLLLMNRRLGDMYRFGTKAERWQQNSPAFTEPGTFFPIALQEIRQNPEVGG